jgi:beta-carotene ketolase (CrtW type)
MNSLWTSPGLRVAAAIVAAWAGLQATVLAIGWSGPSSLAWVVPALAALTWLYTGLFITAHDAMHGTITGDRRVDDRIGAVCLSLYAMLPYARLKAAHVRHHAAPGTPRDPDFDAPGDGSPLLWFVRFFARYATVGQAARLVTVFLVLRFGLGLPMVDLLLFWLLPSVGSAVQLFVVGTWLPHRAGPDLAPPHRARSLDLPVWASLLACFHFGFHLEHHAVPSAPWWRLPDVRRRA